MAANNPDENAAQELTIQGKNFSVPVPYVAGPCDLTAGEAAALNQTFAENVRNNFAAKMKQAAGATPPVELGQADLDEYVDDYEFGKRTGRGPRDPVGTEERRLATTAIKELVATKGKAWKDIPVEKQNELVAKAVATGKFREQAERIIADRQNAAKLTDEISLDLG